jgi:hypothetical protein
MQRSRRFRSWRLEIAAVCVPGAALAAWYALDAYRLTGTLGFPLDDSWIHAQFARNIATGRGYTYTGGEWVSGSTAPAWTLLLAAGYAITRHIVSAAFVLGFLCQAFAGWYALRFAELLGASRVPAVLAGALVGVTPAIVWGAVSGMEVPLAAALALAGIYHHFSGRQARGMRRHVGAALLGASALARPESLAIAGVVAAAELIGRDPVKTRLARCAQVLAVAALVFTPLVVFSFITIGRPLPTTFYAKSGPGIVRAVETRDAAMALRNVQTFGPRAVKNFWLTLLEQYSWAAWLIVPGALGGIVSASSRRITLTLLAILVVVPYAMGLTAPQRLKPENVRYAAQLVVLVSPLLIAGLPGIFRRPDAIVVALAAAAGLAGWQAIQQARAYAVSVKNIQELHVTMGRWISEHIPPGSRVAANDVGAIAYFSRRQVLDLEGLVSPQVLPYRVYQDRGLRVVTEFRPDYLVIFPAWYPDIVQSGRYREVFRISIHGNIISAGDTLIVYKPFDSRPVTGSAPGSTRLATDPGSGRTSSQPATAYTPAPSDTVAAKPIVMAEASASTAARTLAMPFIAQYHARRDEASWPSDAASIIPSGNGAPMRRPAGTTSAIERPTRQPRGHPRVASSTGRIAAFSSRIASGSARLTV